MTDCADKGKEPKIDSMEEPAMVQVPTIRELFQDWQDFDVAEYYFCCLLGLVEYDESFDAFRENKGVFCTKNRMSDVLFDTLESLVALGILEKNDDIQYRYNCANRSLQEIAYNK